MYLSNDQKVKYFIVAFENVWDIYKNFTQIC